MKKFHLSNFLLLIFLIVLTPLMANNTWSDDEFHVSLIEKNLKIYTKSGLLIVIKSFSFNFADPVEVTLDSLSDSTFQIQCTYPIYSDFRLMESNDEPPVATILTNRIKGGLHFYSNPDWATTITIKLVDFGEHYYGLIEILYPDNRKFADLRGTVVDIEAGGNRNKYYENYASVWSAFFMSSKGYGSFFDSFAKGKYFMGIEGETKIFHETGKLDWYVFYGPEGYKIHNSYYNIIGKPKYVPIWACGPVVWRDENKGGANEILRDVDKFTDMKIPITAWWVDRPYSNGANGWSKMDFNDKFADPGNWIAKLRNKYNIRLMTWVATTTFGDTSFPGLFPNFFGYFDLSNPAAVTEYKRRLYDNQYKYGVSGHKMDRGEQYFPVSEPWFDRTHEQERRNKYLYLYSKVQHEIAQKYLGKDHFIFARAAFHRVQPYLSAVWGGDVRSNWDGLASNLANAVRCSYMGFPVWGSDVGGYLGEGRIPEELYVRWLQFGAWSGLFEIKIDGAGGRGEDRPPWKYSKRLQDIFRSLCNMRLELIPYIYSQVNTSYDNGVMMKPLNYVFSDDSTCTNIWDEYMFGNVFLVAPVLNKDGYRKVYLPEGKWYSYDLSKEYDGNTRYSFIVPLNEIPVFIRENSIFPRGNIYLGNSIRWSKEGKYLEIVAVPSKKGKSSFVYVDYFDNDNQKKLSMESYIDKIQISLPNLSVSLSLIVRVWKKPDKVLLNNNEVEFSYDKNSKTVKVAITVSGSSEVLIFL